MAEVFVSYKAEDRPRVRPLVEALKADGLLVWWDAHIDAGEEWRESIASHLAEARCVVVVWSKRSTGTEGRFVRDEAARAAKRHVYLPVTIDKVDPPLGFGETQCLPLSGWKGDRDDPRYLALLDLVRQIVGGARPADHARSERPSRSVEVGRRSVLAGGAVAGLAAAGGISWWLLNGTSAHANSVAVLPFANMSGDPNQAYFSDGMAEEVRSALARISGLKVIGRTSSELLRTDDVSVVAKRLDVGSIVTGSVRRSPTTVRVSAQLVDGTSGVEKWSQTFDRPNGDVLQIQSNIAQAVAEQLRSQLGAADRAALNIGGTRNAAAQDLVLKADADGDASKAGFQKRIGLYEAAITLDPSYASAWAGKAMLSTNLVSFYATSLSELNSGLETAASVARKSIALAPDLAAAHYSLGLNRIKALDFTTGWAEYQRAIASPGCPPPIKIKISNFCSQIGGVAKAEALLRSAADSDPLNPDLILAKGENALGSRRFGEAISLLEQYLAGSPNSTAARSSLATALLGSGRNAEAVGVAELLPNEHPTYFVIRSVAAGRMGDRARAAAILSDMRQLVGDNGSYQYAEMLTAMGNKEGAIAALQSAFKNRDPGLGLLPIDFVLEPLRAEPRFIALVAQLNFPKI